MQVLSSTCFNNHCKYKPAFGTNSIEIFDETGRLVNRNRTFFLRKDLKWLAFIEKIISKFKNAPKVNTYCFACSDGSEPIATVMLLLEKLGKKDAKKFFPIKAYDLTENIIKQANSGELTLSKDDVKKIKKLFGENYKKYMDIDEKYHFDEVIQKKVCRAKVKPIVMNAIEFKTADIVDEIKNIEAQNSIVMARNFWPYPQAWNKKNVLESIFNKLDSNSLLLIGRYDSGNGYNKTLKNIGFKEDKTVQYLYEKPQTKSKELLSNPDYLKAVYIKKS